MSVGTDRRSVLTGLGALGVAGVGGCVSVLEKFVPATSTELDLSALEARHGGRVGLWAYDRFGSARWRASERFTYCSTFKLFLAGATLQRVADGRERLDRAISITASDMVMHAPVTERAVGSTLTVEQLMKATVEVSDNPAANILIRELGGLDAFRAWYRSIGDTVTNVDRLEPELNAFGPGDDRDTTTPVQAWSNLSALLTRKTPLLVPEHRRLLTRWLLDSPTGAGRIKAGVPAGYRVAHKTGTNGDGPTNDIGVIFPPRREPISLAVFFHATSTSTPTQRDAVIADATRLALAALGHGAGA